MHDPNPALAARVVIPQSGRTRPEKQQLFHIFPHFSKWGHTKKYLPAFYHLKLIKSSI